MKKSRLKQMDSKQKENLPFVKYHTRLSLFFNPSEMVFALQMADYERLKSTGRRIVLSKAEYARRMGMKECTFERCVRRFIDLKLLTKHLNEQGNRVFYSFNMELYGKLIRIIAQTSGRGKLLAFFEQLKKESRTQDRISEEEIRSLGC
jgi:hypothetical protein